MKKEEIINLLLQKETAICNRIHNAITEIMRLGYETDRGKEQIPDMIDSIKYILDDIERIADKQKS